MIDQRLPARLAVAHPQVGTRWVLRGRRGERYVLAPGENRVGRHPSCQVWIDHPRVSRVHALVLAGADGGLLVRDLGSTNGTRANNHVVRESQSVRAGDQLSFGGVDFVVERGAGWAGRGTRGADQRRRQRGAQSSRLAGVALVTVGVGIALVSAALIWGSSRTPAAPSASLPGAAIQASTPVPGAQPGQTAVPAQPQTVGPALFPSPVPAFAPVPTDWTRLHQAAAPHVALITVRASASSGSSGTGFWLDDQHVVTNAHVVGSGGTIEVRLGASGGTRSEPATVVGTHPGKDVAVLRVPRGLAQPLPTAPVRSVRVGEEVMAVGSPQGLSGTATFGRVSAVRRGSEVRAPGMQAVIQFDAAINPGNSGGPLVNREGRVVGMVTFGIRDSQGLSFAVSSDDVEEAARSILGGRS